MNKEKTIFVESLDTYFYGYYSPAEKEVLWPIENAHPGYDASFEISKVIHNDIDITNFFDKLEKENLINTKKLEGLIINKIEDD